MGVIHGHVPGDLPGLHPDALQVLHAHLQAAFGFHDDAQHIAVHGEIGVLTGVADIFGAGFQNVDLIVAPMGIGNHFDIGVGHSGGHIEHGRAIHGLPIFNAHRLVLGGRFCVTHKQDETVLPGFPHFGNKFGPAANVNFFCEHWLEF